MDYISEILNDIKKRLTSPFLFSYIIITCIYNWKVTLGLIWYDSKELEEHGWQSVWDFVVSVARPPWVPFGIALGYTFIFPWVNYLIRWYSDWTSKTGENVSFKLSGNTHISIDAFLEVKEKYETEKQRLQTIIDGLTKDKTDAERFRKELEDEQSKYKELFTKFNLMTTPLGMQGDWDVLKGGVTYRYKIDRNSISVSNLTEGKRIQQHSEIVHFFYDND